MRRTLGAAGERAAAKRLESLGYRVVDRNWRCRYGEIDLVATRGDVLAVVEVKTRSSQRFGRPALAVTGRKLARLRLLAGLWLQAHPGDFVGRVRIDVVEVFALRDGLRVQHLEGVG